MIKDEQFVVYLFSRFYMELGFDQIIQMQLKFPDCTALKNGQLVTIEFERFSSTVLEHLEQKILWRIKPGLEVCQTEKAIVVREGTKSTEYSKSDYRLYVSDMAYYIRKKVLNLDYCVCWEINHKLGEYGEELSQIKEFIELSKKPIIIDFMEKRKKSLQLLGIVDKATD